MKRGLLVLAQGWGSGRQRLPERLASSLQPLFDLTFLNRPEPSYSQGKKTRFSSSCRFLVWSALLKDIRLS